MLLFSGGYIVSFGFLLSVGVLYAAIVVYICVTCRVWVLCSWVFIGWGELPFVWCYVAVDGDLGCCRLFFGFGFVRGVERLF